MIFGGHTTCGILFSSRLNSRAFPFHCPALSARRYVYDDGTSPSTGSGRPGSTDYLEPMAVLQTCGQVTEKS